MNSRILKSICVTVSLATVFQPVMGVANTSLQETPELHLMENIVSLSGTKMSTEEMKANTKAYFAEYTRSAGANPVQNLDNIRNAMNTLGLHDPSVEKQMSSIEADMKANLEKVMNAKSVEGQNQITRDMETKLADALKGIQAPQGHQFDACKLPNTVLIASLGVFLLSWTVGVIQDLTNDPAYVNYYTYADAPMPLSLEVAVGSLVVAFVDGIFVRNIVHNQDGNTCTDSGF